MSEALLFNPYGHPRAFSVAGRDVGTQRMTVDPQTDFTTYEVDAVLEGVTPLLCMQRQGLPRPPTVYGPRIPSSETVFADRLHTFTDGWGFPRALCAHDELTRLDDLPRALHRLTLAPLESGRTAFSFTTTYKDQGRAQVSEAIHAARLLAASAENIAMSGRRFPDAWDAVKAEGFTGDPTEDRIIEVTHVIEDAVHYVSGDAERVGNRVEARLRLDEGGLDLPATMTATWRDAEISSLDLLLQADLPEIDIKPVDLSPEPRGYFAFLKTLGEVEVGDRLLDEAFLIEGTSEAKPIILHAKPELLTCAAHGGRVHFGGRDLRVRLFEVPCEGAELRHVLATLIELWRRSALHRAGLTGPVDVTGG